MRTKHTSTVQSTQMVHLGLPAPAPDERGLRGNLIFASPFQYLSPISDCNIFSGIRRSRCWQETSIVGYKRSQWNRSTVKSQECHHHHAPTGLRRSLIPHRLKSVLNTVLSGNDSFIDYCGKMQSLIVCCHKVRSTSTNLSLPSTNSPGSTPSACTIDRVLCHRQVTMSRDVTSIV